MATVNDNFGFLFSTFFRPVSQLDESRTGFKDTSGVSRTLKLISIRTDPLAYNAGLTVSKVQVGKGTSPPTRQDQTIESPFTNGGAEDNPQPTLAYGLQSALGKIVIATLISPTFGSGFITEVAYFMTWRDNTGVDRDFLLFRNVITGVNFISGQGINVEHSVLF